MVMRKKCRKLRTGFDKCPITTGTEPFITRKSGVVTVGSCFALEVYKWLQAHEFNVFYQDAELIWYNTYTILAEFERVAETWEQDKHDTWKVDDRWQDPYRRCVFADTEEELRQKITDINKTLRASILGADVVIITLGLTEVWRQANGRVICGAPGYCKGGGQDCFFHASNFDENYKNIASSVELLERVNPNARVILTVSPVPMFATSRELDQVVANTASKSILRAVADQVVRQYNSVCYFHSYEMVTCEERNKVYKSDGRHVRPGYVDTIMTEFERVFVCN